MLHVLPKLYVDTPILRRFMRPEHAHRHRRSARAEQSATI
jgi:hypothetical protein